MEEQNTQSSFQPQKYVDNSTLSMWEWLGTILLLCIPIANIVLLFVWSFSFGVNENKKNFSRAYLLFTLVTSVLFAIYFIKVMNDLSNAIANFPG